jgi:hypothetical protein
VTYKPYCGWLVHRFTIERPMQIRTLPFRCRAGQQQ